MDNNIVFTFKVNNSKCKSKILKQVDKIAYKLLSEYCCKRCVISAGFTHQQLLENKQFTVRMILY